MEKGGTSGGDDTFYCSICQEIYKTPIKTVNCGHVFCKTCFLAAVQAQGLHCPYCRGPLTDRERRSPEKAKDVEDHMKKSSGNCRCCGKKIKVNRMRLHYRGCKMYQAEYGSPPAVPKYASWQNPVVNRVETASNRTETSLSLPYHPQMSICCTFMCPYCQQTDFDRKGLVEHCNFYHQFDWRGVVCPICVCMPWGNASQISRNFIQHLNLRHKFDYAEFVDIQQPEELQFQAALEESYLVRL